MKEEIEYLKNEVNEKFREWQELNLELCKREFEHYKDTLKINLDLEKDIKEQIYNQITEYNHSYKKNPDRLIIPIEYQGDIRFAFSTNLIIEMCDYYIERIYGIDIEWTR